jgi:hypothetical protein
MIRCRASCEPPMTKDRELEKRWAASSPAPNEGEPQRGARRARRTPLSPPSYGLINADPHAGALGQRRSMLDDACASCAV